MMSCFVLRSVTSARSTRSECGEDVNAPTHLPVDDHRVLAVRGGGGIRVGRLGRHGLDGDEAQRACVVFIGIWEGEE